MTSWEEFINSPPPWYPTLTRPLSYVYRKLSDAMRNRKKELILPCKVLSIGNCILGGAGKTPVMINLLEYLLRDEHSAYRAQPQSILVWIRDYRQKKASYSIQGKNIRGLKFGQKVFDEAQMIAASFPRIHILVTRDEAVLEAFCREQGISLLLIDDGFHKTYIKKDLDILVFPADFFSLNLRVFPAGFLREPLNAIQRADVCLAEGDAVALRLEHPRVVRFQRECLGFKVVAEGSDSHPTPKGKGVVLYLGISRPERVRDFLEKNGVKVKEVLSVPDHRDLDLGILEEALKHSEVVISEKDYFRQQEDLERLGSFYRGRLLRIEMTIKLNASWNEILRSA